MASPHRRPAVELRLHKTQMGPNESTDWKCGRPKKFYISDLGSSQTSKSRVSFPALQTRLHRNRTLNKLSLDNLKEPSGSLNKELGYAAVLGRKRTLRVLEQVPSKGPRTKVRPVRPGVQRSLAKFTRCGCNDKRGVGHNIAHRKMNNPDKTGLNDG